MILRTIVLLVALSALATEKHVNRLAKESSPYLRQHAGNPVDWYPWGDEAFRKARREDKPVFLSIGYSTCHWCHVMERESFEDEATAAILNEHFVSIKVDREERPDVDAIYMAAVTAMTGQGGWPLSVFLTPDRKPFYGGTYFPPEDRFGRPGFPSLLRALSEAWTSRREDVLAGAERLTGHLGTLADRPPAAEVGEGTLRLAASQFSSQFDAQHGGFGGAPKFPRSFALMSLLRQHERAGDARSLEMVTTTLDRMALGGIYDHVGGGFHRYSTDRRWFLPHFEKMLYDQALLARAYVEAFQVTGDERHADVARDVLAYVLRDMTDPAGGFYSAEDADAEGVEGKFTVWSRAGIVEVLGEEDGRFFADTFGATDAGNYHEEASGESTGLNILKLEAPLHPETRRRILPLREKLFAAREKRVHPLKDDKVLTDWNGLMIGTLARAGRALGEERYLRAAEKAAGFVLGNLVRDGTLLHRWRKGEAAIPAFLDDYSFLAEGLLELSEATLDPRWLDESKRLLGTMIRKFGDPEAGGFFLSAADAESHFVRTREIYDGALPSGNSVAALTLLRVGRATGDREMEKEGDRTLRAFSGELAAAPTGYPYLLLALDFAVGPAEEIVLTGDPTDPAFAAMRREVDRRFLPRAILSARPPAEGPPAATVCVSEACHAPVGSAAALAEILDAAR